MRTLKYFKGVLSNGSKTTFLLPFDWFLVTCLFPLVISTVRQSRGPYISTLMPVFSHEACITLNLFYLLNSHLKPLEIYCHIYRTYPPPEGIRPRIHAKNRISGTKIIGYKIEKFHRKNNFAPDAILHVLNTKQIH